MAVTSCWAFTCLCLLILSLSHLQSSDAIFDSHWIFGPPTEPNKCPPGDVRCNDGRCILERWRCDGQKDCQDGSDESNCETPACSHKQYLCDDIRCIPVEWRCDGQKDCQDGSDEEPGSCKHDCPTTHFRCGSGQCVPSKWKCDGEKDCKDGSDEDGETCAKAPKCYLGERACRSESECIAEAMWCDGRTDCRDGSDEADCRNVTTTEAPACQETQFRCRDGRCIIAAWVCDRFKDCSGGEDEQTPDCLSGGTTASTGELKEPNGSLSVPPACKDGDFSCSNGDCIPKNWHCDGGADCEDGSDERDCGRGTASTSTHHPLSTSSCLANELFCVRWNQTSTCLPLSKVCDNHHDCNNGTDEGPGCVTACKDNGKCSDVCHPTPLGPVCTCHHGFALSADGKACEDIDECATGAALLCSQKCFNTKGSFKCACAEGFMLEMDGVTCKADADPLLIYGADSEIHWITPDGHHQGVATQGHHAFITVGIDYLEENGSTSIFYSHSERKEIIQVNIETKEERTVFGGMGCPEGMALDWVSRNLYFVDADKQEIGVCSLRDRIAYCATIIHTSLVNPRGIAVHPGRQMIFFTQWGNGAKIERTWLDGSGRIDIVTDKLIWPNAIALDFIHERLYWIDAKLDWIETAKYDGKDRRTVLHMRMSHPFGLTILGDRLFWTDWTTASVGTSLVNGSSYALVHATTRRPMGIVAMHRSRQPPFRSVCDVAHKNPCDHICLPRPGNLHTCLCHGGFQLVNGKECVPFASTSGTTHAPPLSLDFTNNGTAAPGYRCTSSKDCDCERMTDHSEDHPSVCVCVRGYCERARHPKDIIRGPVVVSGPHIEASLQNSSSERYTAATMAAIICAVILSVIVVVLIIFLVRRYCLSWVGPLDEKNLLDDDVDSPRSKKPRRNPSSVIGGFTNPSYENVNPSSYMVKFYKSRLTHDGPSAPPLETPVSSLHM